MSDGSLDALRPLPDFNPTCPELLKWMVGSYGDNLALVSGARRLTYNQLEQSSAEVAMQLLASGVGKGTRVGLMMPNSIEWVVNWFALTRIGALAVSVSTFSQPRELSWLLRHADIHTLIMVDRYLKHDYCDRLEAVIPGLERDTTPPLFFRSHPYLRQVVVHGDNVPAWARSPGELATGQAQRPALDRGYLREVEKEVSPADLMVVVYTSGSTSRPKAVVHTHGNFIRHTYVQRYFHDRKPGDRIIGSHPFFWIGGLVGTLMSVLVNGAAHHIPRKPDTASMLRQIREERINVVTAWPFELLAMKQHPEFTAHNYDFVTSGFTPPLDSAGNPVDERLRPNSIGMTETVAVHSWEPIAEALPESRVGASGRARSGLERKIVHPETGETLPNGEIGEICIRGYSLMHGFYKKERGECFDPDGFYRTGDQGYVLDDGYLYFTGRKDDVVKASGVNVSTVEVEEQLLKCSEILHAHVVGLDDAKAGKTLVAAIVLKRGETLDAQTVRARLLGELSSYKVPKRFEFLAEEDIPRSASQKVMKPKLAEMLARPMR
ncbi:MAG: class I adenylate-forming enzyme family protein [Gammaproteobacteria bacterium]|nr:class I adenylate-forming enzyme family protein [Gammaproteobacteria bacterium]